MPLATEQYWCVVPAAGVGKRMGGPSPKQYLPLLGKPVAEHTLGTLLSISLFSGIVVALSEEDSFWQQCTLFNSTRITRCAGGAERHHSVLNGLLALEGKAQPGDWVLVHDIARPCVKVADIQRLIKIAGEHPVGGILATPVRDTMKRANSAGEICETVDRSHLWHALTPQMFRYAVLCNAIQQGLDASRPMTDEASAVEALGLQPLLVEGSADNIKITHPQDLPLAALFLQQQVNQKQQAQEQQ